MLATLIAAIEDAPVIHRYTENNLRRTARKNVSVMLDGVVYHLSFIGMATLNRPSELGGFQMHDQDIRIEIVEYSDNAFGQSDDSFIENTYTDMDEFWPLTSQQKGAYLRAIEPLVDAVLFTPKDLSAATAVYEDRLMGGRLMGAA